MRLSGKAKSFTWQAAPKKVDLAVFWDRNDVDGPDKDVRSRMLSWDIDLRIEPHPFARTNFDETDPFVREIIAIGEHIM